jgi:hypothetical protein
MPLCDGKICDPAETFTSTQGPATKTETAPPGRRAQEILQRCFEGQMAFRPPSPLRQGETVEFVVRVALSSSPEDPALGLPGTGDVSRRQPPLCESMRADLSSSKGMRIERTTSEIISLPEAGVGEWGWHLTGTESGKHEMVLRLLAPDPEGGSIAIETYRETITVDVGWTYMASTWIKEMAGPLQALLAVVALLGGWIAFVFTRRHRRGKHAANAPAEK